MRQRIKRGLLTLLILTGALFLVSCSSKQGVDYKDAANWAYQPEEITREADCFLICPTVYFGDETHYNMEMTDEDTKTKFYGALNMERGIYEEACNMYAPYYQQASLSAYQLDPVEREQYLAYAYQDIRAAFTYYMEHENDGRPIVLAGFSQGADMVLRLLEEYFDNNSYQNCLVAAYVIGAAVTPEDLEAYPHLKMAQAEADTGCIISFNSEAPEVNTSILVPDTTLGINPLNWMTDSTEAEASLNQGACFTDYSGNIKEEIPALCGAYLDEKRGTLKITGITPKEYPPVLDLFESGVYHLYDYQFFYRNLQKNVSVRLTQYQTMDFLKKNYTTKELNGIHDMLNEMNALNNDSYSNEEQDRMESAAAKEAEYLTLASHTTPEMLEANHWLKRVVKPDEIIMTQEEITRFNADKKGVFAEFSKEGGTDILSKSDLEIIVQELGAPDYDCYLDGELIEQAYWDALLENRNAEAIQAQNQVRYGISVKRTAVRVLPTDDEISDKPEFRFFDELQNSSIMINEPVLVMHESKDGEWYYILTSYCGGWMHQEDIAVCHTQKEWLEAQPEDDFLLVTGDKLRLEYDPVNPVTSEYEMSMGSRFRLAKPEEFPASEEGRHAADNYIVKLPIRDEEGYLDYQCAYVQRGQDVRIGYLPYTRTNLLELAFKSDGDRYGWGGMYHARDCSQYMQELYRCFGIRLARNSSGQAATNCKTLNLAGMKDAQKYEVLELTPAGSILYFPGHIMMYLGEENGRYYVISSTGSFIDPEVPGTEAVPYQSVMVNDLSAIRKNGRTWIESLAKCKIIWEQE